MKRRSVSIEDKGTLKHQSEDTVKSEIWNSVVVVFSGLVNPERAQLRSLALDMGAKYRPDWCPEATLLVTAFKSTPKVKQVKAAGGTVVLKSFLLDCDRQGTIVPMQPHLLHLGTIPWKPADRTSASTFAPTSVPPSIPTSLPTFIPTSVPTSVPTMTQKFPRRESSPGSQSTFSPTVSQKASSVLQKARQILSDSMPENLTGPTAAAAAAPARRSVSEEVNGVDAPKESTASLQPDETVAYDAENAGVPFEGALQSTSEVHTQQQSSTSSPSSDQDSSSEDDDTLYVIEHVAQRMKRSTANL